MHLNILAPLSNNNGQDYGCIFREGRVSIPLPNTPGPLKVYGSFTSVPSYEIPCKEAWKNAFKKALRMDFPFIIL